MKRGFAARKGTGASLHASAASASRKPTGFRFTFAGGKRFIEGLYFHKDFHNANNGKTELYIFNARAPYGA